MGLLDSESGKRRLLTVEIPVIERYNEDRDAEYKIQLNRLGGTLVLRVTSFSRCTTSIGLETAPCIQLSGGAAEDACPDAAQALPAFVGRADPVHVAAKGAPG